MYKHRGFPLLLLVLLFLFTDFAAAQTGTSPHETPPLDRFLTPDGSLISTTGYSGGIDPGGWSMTVGEGGEPIFARTRALPAAVPEDANWDDRFGVLGVTDPEGSNIRALALDGDKLYVGGNFRVAGTLRTSNIAIWDITSRRWSPLETGIDSNGYVSEILVAGSDVYVGGRFETAGSVRSSGIARWDGSTWNAMGQGVEYENPGVAFVLDMALKGEELFVGGLFNDAGGVTASNIARWNIRTRSWSSVGSGINGIVSAVAADGENVYVGGSFSTAGGRETKNIAKWGTEGWSAVGGGMDSMVSDLLIMGPYLYAIGTFDKADGAPASGIARWNGTNWASIGGGLGNSIPWRMTSEGTKIHITAIVYNGAVKPSMAIRTWDGSSWSGVEGKGDDVLLWTLEVVGGRLYCGGSFRQIGDVGAYNIASWDGSRWHGLETGRDLGGFGYFTAMTVDGNSLYAGGSMVSVGGTVANGLARWDGSAWSKIGGGVWQASAIAVMNSEIYVAGMFDTTVVPRPRGIGRWDGTRWIEVGGGVNGYINDLKIMNGELYAGGDFTTAGTTPARNLAKWDGTSWSEVGGGIDSVVHRLHVGRDGKLYAAGHFSRAGSTTARSIAAWDGALWRTLGEGAENGVDNLVHTIATDDNGNVYVGGSFTRAGTATVSGIARWNGSSWSGLGAGTSNTIGFDSTVRVLTIDDLGNVYIAGHFTSVDGVPALCVANWDGVRWSPLGSGINIVTPNRLGWSSTDIAGIALFGGDLVLAGSFTHAGDKVSFGFARWTDVPTSAPQTSEALTRLELLQNHPNPFGGSTTLEFELPSAGETRITIYSPLGEKMAELAGGIRQRGRHTVEWSPSPLLPEGVYFCRLEWAGETTVRTMTVRR